MTFPKESIISNLDFSNIVFAPSTFTIPTNEEIQKQMNEFDELTAKAEYESYISDIQEMINNQIELSQEEQLDYNNYISNTVNTNYAVYDKSHSVQNKDYKSYYVNYINDVKLRSKNNIPKIQNISCFQCFAIKSCIMVDGKNGKEKVEDPNNKFEDMELNNIRFQLDKGLYELLPYPSYNIYGCSCVKTCFNTIGNEYAYIHPFIDFDLEFPSSNDFTTELNLLYQLICYFTSDVLEMKNNQVSFSAIGYSNAITQDFYTKLSPGIMFSNDSYFKIQSKPQAHKFLSVHVVFYDVKIHCIELKARVMKHYSTLQQVKGFDKAPYSSGSLRHIGSIKAGLVDEEEAKLKRVINLTNDEILHQFITYHNRYINYKYINLDSSNVHNQFKLPEQYKNLKTFNEFQIKIQYGNEIISPLAIEPLLKQLLDKYVSAEELQYANRWSLLAKYVMYKKAIKQPITEENISSILPNATSATTQINFLYNNINSNNPKPLLSYLKNISCENGIYQLDFQIETSTKYIKPKHFGQSKIEDLRNAKSLVDVINTITGSFAISRNGDRYYNTIESIYIYQFHSENHYIKKYYPSRFILIVDDELLSEYSENEDTSDTSGNTESLISLLKFKLDNLRNSGKKARFILDSKGMIDILSKYFDDYSEDGATNFKLNGYNLETVKPEVYNDVCNIIKLFENRLVEGCFTKNENNQVIDNTLQEFLRSIKYLIERHEKPEKAFMAVDNTGATGKSIFFSKIIKDLFGPAGLNDDSLNCLNSSFSDKYRFLYTVFNEVSKGTHDQDLITSTLKQLTDNVMTSARVKNVQNVKTFRNNGIYVLLSNSFTLNGALNIYDNALMTRFVLIEFQPFVKNDKVDSLEGSHYYSLVDKYKTYNDPRHLFTYDFRNALFKYIMDLDITTRTAGRAQHSEYKNEKYREIANDEFKELTNNAKLSISSDALFTVELSTQPTLSKYSDSSKLVGFKISDLTRNKDMKDKVLKALDYKSAYNKKIRYNLSEDIKGQYNDNRFTLIICDNNRFKELVDIAIPEPHLIFNNSI
jgi:hypothetical protein